MMLDCHPKSLVSPYKMEHSCLRHYMRLMLYLHQQQRERTYSNTQLVQFILGIEILRLMLEMVHRLSRYTCKVRVEYDHGCSFVYWYEISYQEFVVVVVLLLLVETHD